MIDVQIGQNPELVAWVEYQCKTFGITMSKIYQEFLFQYGINRPIDQMTDIELDKLHNITSEAFMKHISEANNANTLLGIFGKIIVEGSINKTAKQSLTLIQNTINQGKT